MFLEESLWIKSKLEKLCLPNNAMIADFGCSNFYYRCYIQPLIEKNIYIPLKKRGFNLNSIDSKRDFGVDLVVDIENKEDNSLLKYKNSKMSG